MCIFFFKQKTAYEMRISDWSSDVCSSDLSGQYEIAEGKNGRSQIIITELPYGVNKALLIERFAELVNAEKDPIEGVSDIRDESDRNDKVRIEIGRASCRARVCQYV